ncbi:hypothetical protein M2324_002704 [Rhodovulum sulfidophilum]|uniref:hypothetical protein n=1 Tax=Rhodovulum sulfidophilum TaxID=35806 RepID=UPI0007B55202|nr:hypothetical protein [Rhodovulum sulfidophilum]ANB33925.1 hypothetical protein A6W98_07465 [Rhodovulum sulfidophilum DSM 1374]ANB37747.1 hypothetical protein A6024_07320 [Rhodovulum sulfidophilum]MCW2304299.1 hypothetical protein [Rhodovulum sulfidophilum]
MIQALKNQHAEARIFAVGDDWQSIYRFAADASVIQADANRQNSTPKSDWHPDRIDPEDAPQAVREYLETLGRPDRERASRGERGAGGVPVRRAIVSGRRLRHAADLTH